MDSTEKTEIEIRKNIGKSSSDADDLARDILRLAQSILLIDLRFLEPAFVRITPDESHETRCIAVDGRTLYYDPVYVCRLYRKARELPARDYLHSVLHCVFRHLFVGKKVRRDLWDLACDIAVENIINGFDLRSIYAERQADQQWFLRELNDEIPCLTAEWIYKHLKEKDLDEIDVAHLRRMFCADDHDLWYEQARSEKNGNDNCDSKDEDQESRSGDPGEDDGQENDDGDDVAEGTRITEDNSDDTDVDIDVHNMEEEGSTVTGSPESGNEDRDEGRSLIPDLEQQWKDTAERISLDLETFSEAFGQGAGEMKQSLERINREEYDYSALLKRFSVLGENIEIDDDQFDYIYYSYGMKLYGNMPLIEPLEYKDVKKIRDFVIAIDTSESVSGELVQKFVTKTWNILKQSENFFTRVNVHLIQCSARVVEDIKITTEEEFDEYIRHMVLKGFGGTDFRPVFQHVDDLVRQGEFSNLKGLIYFTDGYGTYPSVAPAYDTVFVILDQGHDIPDVPVWAIKMVMRDDQILEF